MFSCTTKTNTHTVLSHDWENQPIHGPCHHSDFSSDCEQVCVGIPKCLCPLTNDITVCHQSLSEALVTCSWVRARELNSQKHTSTHTNILSDWRWPFMFHDLWLMRVQSNTHTQISLSLGLFMLILTLNYGPNLSESLKHKNVFKN